MGKRRICIVTGTRADWGLLSRIARALALRDDVRLQIVATNMHLDPRYGKTEDEIERDGFIIDERVPMPSNGDDSEISRARAMGVCAAGMADAFGRLKPDLLLILGDRYEMLAVASVASVCAIPIAHIAGGEITEGAIDDNIRHAITKLSTLHLTATEDYRRRVIQMGEHPRRVINTGAIGVANIYDEEPMTAAELEASLGFPIRRGTLLVTYHPATLDPVDPSIRFGALLDALDTFANRPVLFTYPNNDARGRVIIDMIEQYAAERPDRVKVVPSLGRRRYLSALRLVAAVVGNSSSGIVEVPSLGIPTVDIGIRQLGRTAAQSVIHCGDSTEEIAKAIALALQYKPGAMRSINPYYKPGTLDMIVEALTATPDEVLAHKRFYDLPRSSQPESQSGCYIYDREH